MIADFGSPFIEDSGDLLTLDTKDIMDDVIVDSLKQALKLGTDQYCKFVDEDSSTDQSLYKSLLRGTN